MKKITITLSILHILAVSVFSQQTVLTTSYLPERILRKAFEYLGTPYRYGGTTQEGVDCSGMVYAVFLDTAEISLPRSVGAIYNSREKVNGILLPGDLVFFNTTGGPSHVGIFIGGTKFIHAASAGPRTGVIVSSLTEKYYRQRFIGACRVVQAQNPEIFIDLGSTRKKKELTGILPEKWPLVLSLKNRGDKAGDFYYTILKDGKTTLQKKISIQEKATKALKITLPNAGNWTILIHDPNRGVIAEISVVVGKGFTV